MSKEDELLAVGRLVADYTEVKRQLSIADTEAARIGRHLQRLGETMQKAPSVIEPTDEALQVISEVGSVLTDCRALQLRYVELHTRMRALGLAL